MGFFGWHYSAGINLYLHLYTSTLLGVVHYFSLPYLIPTLFSPYKKMIMPENRRGMSFQEKFNIVTFNLVSRLIGFVVRILLFVFGTLAVIFISVTGFFGLFIWVVLPFFSIPFYLKYIQNPERLASRLKLQIEKEPKKAIYFLLQNRAGQFISEHIDIHLDDLISAAEDKKYEINKDKQSYLSLFEDFVQQKAWDKKFLLDNGLTIDDLLLTASWWEEQERLRTFVDLNPPQTSSGIGRELTFGFTANLDKYAVDLALETKDFRHQLIGRKNIIDRLDRTFNSGTNVVLTGEPGVGKRTVTLEFSKRAMLGELSKKTNYRRVLEVDLNFLASESSDLNQKKLNLGKILAEATYAGNIVLVVKDLHRYTNSNVEGIDFTDIFETYMEKDGLMIIAISSSVDYERYLAPNSRLRKYFDKIEVEEPSKAEAMKILIDSASEWEFKNKITITIQSLRKIIEGSNKYVSDTPFPEKSLEILTAVITFHGQNAAGRKITVEEVDNVLTERTGVPMTSLNNQQRNKLSNLEEIMTQRLVGQPQAINLISKVLRSKYAGVVNTNRPLGSFLFLGPTGVGKTETAKVLARVYFGTEMAITRFDMSEYVGSEGLERLIGSQQTYQPGVLTNAIKNHPASLLLLDEIEKAPPEIFNLFLAMLDEGTITDAFGNKLNCSNLFVIATSNAGAEYIRQKVTSGETDELQKKVTDHVMKQNIFSPEFINRFDSVVVYKPLSKESLLKISQLMLSEMSANLQSKNIDVEFSEEAIQKLAEDGYEPEFGARPMRRIIDLNIGDLIGKAILENRIESGDKIIIIPGEEKAEFAFQKSLVA